jgi:DNA polymerase-3 subunit epsilon
MFEHLVLTRPLAIFDLETTGTSPERDRIVEISVVKALPAGGVETKTRRVNPGIPIPKAATAVHKISDADVAGEPHFRQLAKGLLEFLDGCDLCGFNIRRFDLPFLNAEFRRSGLEFSVQGRAVVDAMEIFHAEEPRSLTGAVKFYLEKTHEGAHGAEADAVATARVLDAMAARYPHLPSGVEALDKKMRFPNQMDVAGNFESVRGKPRFTFGKHEGKFLADVVRDDPGYLSWVLNGGFLDDTKAIIRQAMQPDLFSAPGE